MVDTNELKKRIAQKGVKKQWLATQLGLSRYGLFLKLEGKNDFYTNEAVKLCDALGITDAEEKNQIFFGEKVD